MVKCCVRECNKWFQTKEEKRDHYERLHQDYFDYCPRCIFAWKKPGQKCSARFECHVREHYSESEMRIVWEEYNRERSNGRIPRFLATSPDSIQQYSNPQLDEGFQAEPSEGRRTRSLQAMFKCGAPNCGEKFKTEEELRTHREHFHQNHFEYCPGCSKTYKKITGDVSAHLKKHLEMTHCKGEKLLSVWTEYKMEREQGRVPQFLATAPYEKQQYYKPPHVPQLVGGPSEDHRQAAAPNLPSNVNIPGTSQNDSRPSASQIRNPNTAYLPQGYHDELFSGVQSDSTSVVQQSQYPQQEQFAETQLGSSQHPIVLDSDDDEPPAAPEQEVMAGDDPRYLSAPNLPWPVNDASGMMDNQAHRIQVNPTVNYRASYPPSANWQQQNNFNYQSHNTAFFRFPNNQPATSQSLTAPPQRRTLRTNDDDPCRDLATPRTFAHASSSSSSTFPQQFGGSNPMAPPNVPLQQQQFYEQRQLTMPNEQQVVWNSSGGLQSTSSQPFYPSAPPSGSGNTVHQGRGTRRQYPSADAEYDAPESQPGCSSSSSSSGQSKRPRK